MAVITQSAQATKRVPVVTAKERLYRVTLTESQMELVQFALRNEASSWRVGKIDGKRTPAALAEALSPEKSGGKARNLLVDGVSNKGVVKRKAISMAKAYEKALDVFSSLKNLEHAIKQQLAK